MMMGIMQSESFTEVKKEDDSPTITPKPINSTKEPLPEPKPESKLNIHEIKTMSKQVTINDGCINVDGLPVYQTKTQDRPIIIFSSDVDSVLIQSSEKISGSTSFYTSGTNAFYSIGNVTSNVIGPPIFEIVILGDVKTTLGSSGACNIKVMGSVQRGIQNNTGNIHVEGSVSGSVINSVGNIHAGSVGGTIKTNVGNIHKGGKRLRDSEEDEDEKPKKKKKT